MQRREFIHAAATAGVVSPLLTGRGTGAEPDKGPALLRFDTANEVVRGDMRYRKLGNTGVEVSCIGVGGHHIGRPADEAEGIKIIRTALDAGMNFLDNCWDYHDGLSELRMGKALQDGYRKKAFLMTKIDGRTKAAAAKQIDQCLLRLRTDVIDLVQHHEMIRMEDADRVFGEGGAQEAVEAARKAGKIRFVGFTGHKDPLAHLRTLEVAKENGFRFDAVQMPLNVLDAHFRSFARDVLPGLVKEQIGVLGMKSMGDGLVLQSKAATAVECLNYALTLPTSVVITGMETMDRLKQALDVVKSFKPLTEDQVAALLGRTKEAAAKGRYERFKTTPDFDGTAKHPEWMG
ncbi:General stress protein 69 [Gemmata obscuriglobus]|uniref:Aldo/keto reductase n=1 Tax=Gemmata obscuriglobus TaxID=114 RepID=A0A2Z3H3F7_9BACT|nr:aldo/keto reductase [Gemmata obscuriglobus]AWM36154.1 aldo/keto reductase [Gemmata obscuriglobus]QEG31255.1 General stress protein 69 [Gemmata obscuriglobus]VTS10593.1 aldo keto reductase : NADP-dependent oxidoreductase domain protein OS=Calothrix sp. PCC 6303 GN=Cal6303_3837 PE=4 SV=1: Aldo_ket_red [Gemmata obscuriglobus UQM 2246]